MHPAFGISGGVAIVILMIVIRTLRRKKPTETSKPWIRDIAAKLAWYYGTYRILPTDGKDPIVVGRKILEVLGKRPAASVSLRALAQRCTDENRFPDLPESGSSEFNRRAQAISGFCETLP